MVAEGHAPRDTTPKGAALGTQCEEWRRACLHAHLRCWRTNLQPVACSIGILERVNSSAGNVIGKHRLRMSHRTREKSVKYTVNAKVVVAHRLGRSQQEVTGWSSGSDSSDVSDYLSSNDSDLE